jgi:hypothetical protein
MNAQLHTIDKLTFDFTIDQNVLDPFKVNMYNEVSTYLLPVIDEVFNSPIFSEYDISIDTLTIDLGRIVIEDESIKHCADILKRRIEDELKKQIRNNTSNNCIVLPRKKNDACILLQYLKSGIIIKKYSGTPEYLLEDIIKNNSCLLVQFLIDNRNNESIIRRLVWQFNIELIEKIIAVIIKSEYGFVLEFMNKLHEQQKATNVSKEKSIDIYDNNRYHRHILEFTLKYCLSEQQVQFNRVDFVQRILTKISNHYNLELKTFLHTVFSFLQSTVDDSPHKKELLYLLNVINQKYKKSDKSLLVINRIAHKDTIDRYPGSGQKYDNKGCFLSYAISFLKCIDSGTSKEQCEKMWDLMIRESIQKTTEFLYKNFNSRSIIRNFVLLMNNDRVNECIKLVAQDNLEFIVNVIKNTDSFLKSNTLKKQPVVLTTSYHKQYLYEFILEYCIHRKNGIFSELAFTQAILIEIANHHNITFTSLIVTFLEFLINEVRCEENGGYAQLLNSMQQLHFQHCKTKIPGTLSINKKITRQIGIVAMYENIVQYIIEGDTKVNDKKYNQYNSFQNDLQNVYHDRPDLIYSLFQKIKTTPDYIRSICINTNVLVCNALMALFIESIVDKYNMIQWKQSRHETVFNIKKRIERSLLPDCGYDVLLNILFTLDFSTIINEDALFETITTKIHSYKKGIDKNNSEKKNDLECKQCAINAPEMLSTESVIEYLYYFIEHPGNFVYKGITKDQLLDYCIVHYKETVVNEIIHILLRRPDLKNVLSQSNFLFDRRLRCCLHQSPKFRIIVKAYKQRYISNDNGFNCNTINRELLNYMCSESNDSNVFNNGMENDDFENAIKTVFTFLHSGTVLNRDAILKYGQIIESLIKKSPARLKWWIKDSSANTLVIDNLLNIITESQFLELLLLFGSHTAMVLYSYYITIKNLMIREIPEDTFIQQDKNNKKVVLTIVFKCDTDCYSDNELVFKIGNEYENSVSDQNEKKLIKRIIEQSKCEFNADVNKVNKRSAGNDITNDTISHNCNSEIDTANLYNEELNIVKIVDDIEKEEILVTNAGIVLGAAYLERLFEMLKMTGDKKFIDDFAIQKCLKILHYFSTGNSDCLEYQLTLNKIICGVPLDYQIDPEVEISESEKETADSLVDAIINNWPVMKNTKRDSFRESFLNRRGFISKCDDTWLLHVEKRAFDMLIDTLPWGFSMIKLPWMKQILQTTWNEE